MSTSLVLPAEVRKGKLLMNAKRVTAWLKGRKDGPYTVTIERRHATRSTLQNAWYWGGILPAISEHTGYTVDEVHEYCKHRFNAKVVTVANEHGEIIDEQRIGQSTTGLNKLTFGEYCEAIRRWAAADLGVVIPDPDPHWKDKEHAA